MDLWNSHNSNREPCVEVILQLFFWIPTLRMNNEATTRSATLKSESRWRAVAWTWKSPRIQSLILEHKPWDGFLEGTRWERIAECSIHSLLTLWYQSLKQWNKDNSLKRAKRGREKVVYPTNALVICVCKEMWSNNRGLVENGVPVDGEMIWGKWYLGWLGMGK